MIRRLHPKDRKHTSGKRVSSLLDKGNIPFIVANFSFEKCMLLNDID